MSLGQLSSEFIAAAKPAISISVGVVGVLLLASILILRGKALLSFIRRVILRNPQYDYHRIFRDYLERFNSISDRRELYPAILSAACRIVGARGASLIVRDSNDSLQMKATYGVKPFAFDVDGMKGFLDWMEKKRDIVSRKDLVCQTLYRDIKSEGLKWFVQFSAEACLPLFVGDRLYGVINLGDRADGSYDGGTRDLLKLLAVQFATAIHNANLYQALLRQNLKLQEVSKFKTQLMANISHELRTPLTSIIGLSELLAEGGDGSVNEEQMSHLSIIRASGQKLLDTVNSMLDLSKLEANRMHLQVQKLSLGRLTTQVVGDLSPNKFTTIEVNMGEDTPGVYGDEKRLRQVLKHLLDNAVKFTKRGKILVGAEKCGDMLRVCVRDTGIGIDKEKQRLIFEGFCQADGSATREYNGLGVGLTISKKLVELHGGRMWLSSKVGKGSAFYFTLPLKPAGVYAERVAHPSRCAS